jgi:hypothetical protein
MKKTLVVAGKQRSRQIPLPSFEETNYDMEIIHKIFETLSQGTLIQPQGPWDFQLANYLRHDQRYLTKCDQK